MTDTIKVSELPIASLPLSGTEAVMLLQGGTSKQTNITNVVQGGLTGAFLNVPQGGTGLSSYTLGDILYSSATNTLGKLPIGSVNQVLAVGPSGVPFWQTIAGTGTVTDVSVVTANGVSGTVATSTVTPAITLTLGAITPTSVNSVVLSGSAAPTLAVTGTSAITGSNSGDVTLAAVGVAPNANGASLTGQALTLQPADGTNPGVVTTSAQTFAGAKTFSSTIVGDISGNAATVTNGLYTSDRDATGKVPGLTGFNINFKNVVGTFTSYFTNTNTASRTYTFKDADGTVAFTSDITGTNSGTNTGDVTLAAVGSSPNANGATLAGQALTLQPADATSPGLVTAGAQTFGGDKIFNGKINKVTITAPTTSATLTIADGKGLTVSNTLTLTGTDSSSIAFGAGGTVVYTGAATGSGLTMNTARMLGRTTASSGAMEEISIGTGLSLAGGTLSNTVTATANPNTLQAYLNFGGL